MAVNSPCRLSVYQARTAPVAAVLRRGPSEWVQLSLWHTDTDEFEHGQWLRARVYERRCDISPDGMLFAYFAFRGAPQLPRDLGVDSWIAVSRPPYFTALALWKIGGTYCTGAQFPSAGELFLGGTVGAPDQGDLPSWLSLTTTPSHRDTTPDWTDRTVYFSRLLRDGWKPVPNATAVLPWWERTSPNGKQVLVMMPRSDTDFRTYGGRHVTEYGIRDDTTEDVRDIGRATWADWDARGRLLLAKDGAIRHWRSEGDIVTIADFNDQAPAAEASPLAAREWPAR